MKTTTMPRSWRTLAIALPLALAMSAPGAPAAAQDPDAPPPPRGIIERSGERDCRCVDADGNEIEGCVCIAPGLEALRGGLRGLRGGLEGLRGGLEGMGAYFSTVVERRARIGVGIDYGQDEARGAVIQDVMDDSPAAEAGLRVGDVVTHVDGRSLLDPLDDAAAERALDEDASVAVQRFVRLVGALDPGAPVELRLVRDGRERTLRITPEPARGLVVSAPVAPGGGSYRFFPEGDVPGILRLDADSVRRGIDSLEVRLRRGLEPLRDLRWRFEMDDDDGPFVYRFEGPGGNEGGTLRTDSLVGRVFRNGGTGPFAVVRGMRADPCLDLREGGGGWPLGGGDCIAGADLLDLNPDLGSYFGTDEGVLVAQVAEASPLGLRAGDVILAIDGREVRSASHARRILESYEGDEEMRIRVLREGAEREVMGRRR